MFDTSLRDASTKATLAENPPVATSVVAAHDTRAGVAAVHVTLAPFAWTKVSPARGVTTVRVKACVAFGAMPLLAVSVTLYVPPVPRCGDPVMVAVPSLPAAKTTPAGSAPCSET